MSCKYCNNNQDDIAHTTFNCPNVNWCNQCHDFCLHDYESCPHRFVEEKDYVWLFLIEGKQNTHIGNVYKSKKAATRAMVDALEKLFREDERFDSMFDKSCRIYPTRKEIKQALKRHRKNTTTNEPYYYVNYIEEIYRIVKIEIQN